MVNNAFKYQKLQLALKHCLKWHYGKLFGILGKLYSIFVFLSKQKKSIYLLLLLIFLPFQIKISGFHLKEEGKELLGMLMAVLAK